MIDELALWNDPRLDTIHKLVADVNKTVQSARTEHADPDWDDDLSYALRLTESALDELNHRRNLHRA